MKAFIRQMRRKKSFRKAVYDRRAAKSSVWTWDRWAGAGASLLTIGTTVYLIVGRFDKAPVSEKITVIFICSLLVLSLIATIAQEYRFGRKARYSEAASSYHDILHSIRDISRQYFIQDDPPSSINSFRLQLKEVVNHIAAYFSFITGVNVRACIKVINEADNGSLIVKTLIRHTGGTSPVDQKIHLLENNTDFSRILAGDRWYFSNDLTSEPLYNNTSRDTDHTWQDDYVSSIVVPIRYTPYQSTGEIKEKDCVIGFLCIDASTFRPFDERFDTWALAGIADSLYSLMAFALTLEYSPCGEHGKERH